MKIYFAHPCFTGEQREIKKKFMKKIAAGLILNELNDDIVVIDPFEHTPAIEDDTDMKKKMAENVKMECIRLSMDTTCL